MTTKPDSGGADGAGGSPSHEERWWDRALIRERSSSAWRLWHRVAVGVLVLLALSEFWAAINEVGGSVSSWVWSLITAVILAKLAHREIAIVRQRPDPPDDLWPVRRTQAGQSGPPWRDFARTHHDLRQRGRANLEMLRRYDETAGLQLDKGTRPDPAEPSDR